jgi:hypothetical protein
MEDRTENEPDRELRVVALTNLKRRRAFATHAVGTALAAVLITAVWAITEYQNAGGWPTGFRSGRQHHDWDPWIIYPWIAGVVSLAAHAWVTYGRRPTTERDIAAEMDRLSATRRGAHAADSDG